MARGFKTGGRQKGTQNKITRDFKASLLTAFELMQGEPGVNLFDWAKQNPTDFYKICSKLITINMHAELPEARTIINIIPDLPNASGETMP